MNYLIDVAVLLLVICILGSSLVIILQSLSSSLVRVYNLFKRDCGLKHKRSIIRSLTEETENIKLDKEILELTKKLNIDYSSEY